jgi:hypothetical protein
MKPFARCSRSGDFTMAVTQSPAPASTAARKLALVAAIFCALAIELTSSERAVVKIVCPLDSAEFSAVQDFSGYSVGMRLDFRKMGAISQPWALARCPECGFPVYQKYFGEPDLVRLREIVASQRFRTEALPARAWFALGILREELKAEPFEIATTYLNASWEAENENDAESYSVAARRAIEWFDRAAVALKDLPEKAKDRCAALYLPVELARRVGDFAQAQKRLRGLPDLSAVPWLPAALQTQAKLIAEKNSSANGDSEDAWLK